MGPQLVLTAYELITTFSTLASLFSTVLAKNLDANLDLDNVSIVLDDRHVRLQANYACLTAYPLNLLSIVFLLLPPRQKVDTQQLKRGGRKSE